MDFSLLIYYTSFAAVLGCGQLPQRQDVLRFTVQGTYRLANGMVYFGEPAVQLQVPTMLRSEDVAKKLVQNLIMNAVEDVLTQQGRSALLPDAVILQILQQLTVNTTYAPLQCRVVSTTGAAVQNFMVNMREGCFVTGAFVTMLCEMQACDPANPGEVKPVTSNYLTFTGTLMTSNVIMATWSRQIWADVLNRVHRQLSSSTTPFGMFFASATVMQN